MTNNGCKTDGKCSMLSIPRKKFSINHARGKKLSSYFAHKNDVTQLLEEEMIKIYASKIKGKKEGFFFFTQVVHTILFS